MICKTVANQDVVRRQSSSILATTTCRWALNKAARRVCLLLLYPMNNKKNPDFVVNSGIKCWWIWTVWLLKRNRVNQNDDSTSKLRKEFSETLAGSVKNQYLEKSRVNIALAASLRCIFISWSQAFLSKRKAALVLS